jgi:hypothetical protein
MSLRQQIEAAPDTPPVVEATDESYSDGILCLAKIFLHYLDTERIEPQSNSAMDFGDRLYIATREAIPDALKQELTGNQVASAAHLAYRAQQGD